MFQSALKRFWIKASYQSKTGIRCIAVYFLCSLSFGPKHAVTATLGWGTTWWWHVILFTMQACVFREIQSSICKSSTIPRSGVQLFASNILLAYWQASASTKDKIDLQVSKAALALFEFGQNQASKQGLILVDTKYEFGKDPDGNVMLIDEIHTPDSSRCFRPLICFNRKAT